MSGAAFGTVYGLADLDRIERVDVEALVFKDLQHALRLIRAIRFGATLALLVLAILLLTVEDSVVSFGIVLAFAVVLLFWTLFDKTGVDPTVPVTTGSLVSVIGAAFCVQTVIIVFTGAVESPFLVIYIAIMMLVAVVIGRLKVFWLMLSLPATAIVVFVVGYATGAFEGLLPSFLGHPVVYWTITGGVIIGVSIIAGNVVLLVRGALERSIQAAAEARSRTFAMVVDRNRELLELSGALAHELKNPLTAIQGLTTVVSRKLPADSKQAEQMTVVLDEVKRMGSILEEFLNFSRPSQLLSIETVTPSSLIDDVVSLHEVYASRRGIGFYVTIDSDPPLSCDARKIKQVLVNLVQNALDATPDGGQIAFGVRERSGESLMFTVDDTGPGLSGEIQGRLFTPGTTTKAAGSGLGLTIAQAITHQHGGTLTLADRPKGGCRATLTLPLSVSDPVVAEEPAI